MGGKLWSRPEANRIASVATMPRRIDQTTDAAAPRKPAISEHSASANAALSACTYLELCAFTSSKFWEVTVHGSSTTVRYGKIGANGTSQHKDHDDDDVAEAFAQKQIAAKMKQGYSNVEQRTASVVEVLVACPSGTESVRLSGRKVPDLLMFAHNNYNKEMKPLVKIERNLVEIPHDIDHILVAVALNRIAEVKVYLAESGNETSGDRLLSALYASMICGHDSIANELTKHMAANVKRGDEDIEPLLYLCWTLLCVGWCSKPNNDNLRLSAEDMKPTGPMKKKKKKITKFKLQNFDEVHVDKARYEEELTSYGLDSDAEYDGNEDFWMLKNSGYEHWGSTMVDTRHLSPVDTGSFWHPPLRDTTDLNTFIYEWDDGCDGFQENFFDQARLWKRVVDEEFGDNTQRFPKNAMYAVWHEWWLSECATRPSNESRTVLMGEGPAGCSVQTLLRIVAALPPIAASASIKQRITDKAWMTFEQNTDKTCTAAVKQLMAEPHWQIGNPREYSRLVRDLMKSQSNNWVTSSRDIRATIIVMAGLDIFVRPTAENLAYEQRIGVLAGLAHWPTKSPLEPSEGASADDDAMQYDSPGWRGHPKAMEINRGLVFVSDCDAKSFDMTDIPPTGLLPMHTLIAYRVKSEFGNLSKSGAVSDGYQTADGRPFMVNAASPTDLAAGRTHVKLTAMDALTPTTPAHVAEGWNEWPLQQIADVSLDETITQSLSLRRCQELHAKWMHNALDEHASVAAFSKFILELMAIGAPPHLLAWAHRASLQEIDHACLCVMMASAFAEVVNGADVDIQLSCVIGCLPDFKLSVTGSVSDIATSTLLEGAVGETQAALQLAIRLDASLGVSQGRLRNVLKQLMHDETSHGALAWATLRWMVFNRNDDGEAMRAIQTAIETMRCKYVPGGRGQMPLMFGSLVSDGFVCDDVAMSLEALCFWEVIEPLAGMAVNIGQGGWELEAVTLRQLAPTNMEVVLDEMVLAIRQ